MSEKLFEAGLPTIDLRSILSRIHTGAVEGTPVESDARTSTAETTGASGMAAKTPAAQAADGWKRPLLDDHKFQFKQGVIEKLDALGEPFKKALKVLGYNIELENGGNPLLAFVHGDFGQKRLLDGKLNANTFKAIYNTVSKHLVADSEFFEENDYNILYCIKLYNKSPREIESYLILQAQILKPSAQGYSKEDKNKNKKVFLQSTNRTVLDELNLEKRAALINEYSINELGLEKLVGADLNSLELAKLIKDGSTSTEKVHLGAAGQNKIIKAIKDDLVKIFATLMAISLNTGGKKAKQALKNELFAGVTAKQLAEATVWLAENNIITKGQLRGEDADELVDKINTLLSER